jgi:hypothetical protein
MNPACPNCRYLEAQVDSLNRSVGAAQQQNLHLQQRYQQLAGHNRALGQQAAEDRDDRLYLLETIHIQHFYIDQADTAIQAQEHVIETMHERQLTCPRCRRGGSTAPFSTAGGRSRTFNPTPEYLPGSGRPDIWSPVSAGIPGTGYHGGWGSDHGYRRSAGSTGDTSRSDDLPPTTGRPILGRGSQDSPSGKTDGVWFWHY